MYIKLGGNETETSTKCPLFNNEINKPVFILNKHEQTFLPFIQIYINPIIKIKIKIEFCRNLQVTKHVPHQVTYELLIAIYTFCIFPQTQKLILNIII